MTFFNVMSTWHGHVHYPVSRSELLSHVEGRVFSKRGVKYGVFLKRTSPVYFYLLEWGA